MIILKSESWQIFTILIFPLIIVSILPEEELVLISVSLISFMTFFFGWLFLLGFYLNKSLPNFKRKHISLLIISCLFLFLSSTLNIINNILIIEFYEFPEFLKLFMFLVFISAFFYVVNFNSRIIYSIEKQKKNAEFDDYKDIFYFIIALPIGIWFLQPKIKKIAILYYLDKV